MTTATPTRRTPGLSAEQRRARQDELLATLADGVQSLTTSDGWRRYLRAMTTLRTYSTGNTHISESRECPQLWRVLVFVQPVLGAGGPVLAKPASDLGGAGHGGGDPPRYRRRNPVAKRTIDPRTSNPESAGILR